MVLVLPEAQLPSGADETKLKRHRDCLQRIRDASFEQAWLAAGIVQDASAVFVNPTVALTQYCAMVWLHLPRTGNKWRILAGKYNYTYSRELEIADKAGQRRKSNEFDVKYLMWRLDHFAYLQYVVGSTGFYTAAREAFAAQQPDQQTQYVQFNLLPPDALDIGKISERRDLIAVRFAEVTQAPKLPQFISRKRRDGRAA